MFIDELKKQLVAVAKNIYGNREQIESIIDGILKKYIVPTNAILDNNYKNTRSTASVEDVVNSIMNDDKITLTGQAVMYDKTIENISAIVLDELADKRKYWKKIMLDTVNTDPVVSTRADLFQVNYKEFANSYYGISLNAGSIFFNKYNGLAVTSTGQTAIMTAIISLESIFGNQAFPNFSDLMLYIEDVKTHATKNILEIIDTDMIKTKQEVVDFIAKKCMFDMAVGTSRYSQLVKAVDNLNDNELQQLYYRNNFYEFIPSTKVSKIVYAALGTPIVVDKYIKNKFSTPEEERGIKIANMLMQVLEDFVIMYRLPSQKYKIVNNLKRRTIIHTDTDSVFIYLHPFIRFCQLLNRADRFNNVNLITVMINKYVAKSMLMLSDRLKTSAKNRTRLEMKNESLFRKVIMTRNKKNYMTLPEVKEGKILEKMKVDIKGLSIKKSTLHKNVRDFFASVVNEELFRADTDEINVPVILKKIFDFKTRMRAELSSGSIEYSSTLKMNNIATYKNPYSMPVVRGSIVWNALYPENPIQNSQKCGSYSLVGLTTEHDLDKISDTDIRETIRGVVFADENMKDRGVVVLAFPKNITSLPEWVRPFIDVDAIIEKNIANMNPTMEALGIHIYDKGGYSYMTSIVEI